jgi:uncharacterized protein (TIGR03000 family)
MFRNRVEGSVVRALAAALLLAAWPGKAPAQETGPAVQVTIRLRVPEGAEVWFDGTPTLQTGGDRSFVSPPLDPGRTYLYIVRVRWADGGGTVEKTRTVRFRAGDQIGLYFEGAGFVGVQGYEAADVPAASFTPAIPAVVPAPAYRVPAAMERPRLFRGDDYWRRGGPPGSNNPLSLGVGNG